MAKRKTSHILQGESYRSVLGGWPGKSDPKEPFDEKTGEHVFILEYRVVKGEHSDPKKRKEPSIKRRVAREEVNSLLRDINDRANLGFPQTP